MKYIKKIPDEKKEVTEELIHAGWKPLKEPSKLSITIAIALPIGLAFMILTWFWSGVLFPESINFFKSDGIYFEFTIDLKILFYLVGILIYTFIHEMIHAFTIPDALHSDKIFWGFNGCFGFVYAEEHIKKGRYILVSIMPLFVLSFIVPLVLRIFNFCNGYLLLLCVINAGGSCVDILNMILIAKQVPKNGEVISNGIRTLYR